MNFERFSAAAVAALLVVSVLAFAGVGAAAFTSYSVTPDSDATGAATNHDHSVTFSTSGSVKEITLDYEETDVQSVGSGNLNVTIAGTEASISDASGSGTSTLVITLQSSVSVSSADTMTITSTGDAFVNPQNTGDYTVEMNVSDGTSVFDSGTATLSIGSVGSAPSINSTGDLQDDYTIQGYTGDANTTSTVQIDANTKNVAFKVLQDGDRYLKLTENADSFSVLENATSTTAGTYQWAIPHDKLEALPIAAGENATFTGVAVNSSNGQTNQFTFHVNNTGANSQLAVNSASFTAKTDGWELPGVGAASTLSIASYNISTPSFGILSADNVRSQYDDVAVAGNNSTVTVSYQNETAMERFGMGLDKQSGAKDYSNIVKITDDGDTQYVAPYVAEAPSDVNESATYAVADNETDRIKIYLGDQYDSQSSIDEIAVNANAGFGDRFGAFGLRPYGVGFDFNFLSLTAPSTTSLGVAA